MAPLVVVVGRMVLGHIHVRRDTICLDRRVKSVNLAITVLGIILVMHVHRGVQTPIPMVRQGRPVHRPVYVRRGIVCLVRHVQHVRPVHINPQTVMQRRVRVIVRQIITVRRGQHREPRNRVRTTIHILHLVPE